MERSNPTGFATCLSEYDQFRGCHGLEEMKWAEPGTDQVIYDVIAPFIRMVAGPLDYTVQGAMNNVIMKNFHAVYTEPMSQGTLPSVSIVYSFLILLLICCVMHLLII